jgi:hypothetical protein
MPESWINSILSLDGNCLDMDLSFKWDGNWAFVQGEIDFFIDYSLDFLSCQNKTGIARREKSVHKAPSGRMSAKAQSFFNRRKKSKE